MCVVLRYPCFENPYPMDIHESPVTGCLYLADCPHDLIPAFYSVGSKQKKTGFSDRVSVAVITASHCVRSVAAEVRSLKGHYIGLNLPRETAKFGRPARGSTVSN